jgi:phenylacetate-CoA ligase
MNRLAQWLYDRTPVAVQNGLLTAYSAWLYRQRNMGDYPRYRQLFQDCETRASDEVQAWQDETLAGLVTHAYETVPYYRSLFERMRLKPSDIRGRDDLAKLPVLTKELIKQHFEDLISREYNPKKLAHGHTSGTTGTPLEVCYDPATVWATYAALDRQYRWAGCRLERKGDRVAVIRGNVIVPLRQHRPPYWRYNRFHNHVLMSSFHLRPEVLDHYFDELARFRPVALDSYPSNLFVLAKHLKNAKRTFPIKAVLTSSETVFDFQREMIEESFECRLFDYYGLAERTVFAVECARHRGHHLCEDYGISEILDDELTPVSPGTTGKLVTTSLHNRAMPLLRYVTNDRTAVREETCDCGCSFALMDDVATKAEDTLTLKDGRLVSPSALTHPFKPLNSIAESQIIQKDYDHIVVKVVRGPGFSDADTESLIAGLKERLGRETRVEVEFVDRIPRSAAGKFRWVISEVSLGI